MRILILTPTALPLITGNAMTTERWHIFLQQKGIEVKVLATQGAGIPDLIENLRSFHPDLIHVLHAFRAGALLLDANVIPCAADVPLVIAPGGTDINLDFEMEERRETVTSVYRKARKIIAQSREISQRLSAIFPALRDRIAHVPQTLHWLGHDRFDLREAAGWGLGGVLFFLPAGIRPVKGNLECLKTFEEIHARRPCAKVVFAGPILDIGYGAEFKETLSRLRSFAHWIPSIPPEAMRSAYKSSDIVLNTSFSEGLSNALIEAVGARKPILASDIPGNRWPILGEDGDPPTGLLFRPNDPDDLIRHSLALIDDAQLRETFARNAFYRASRWPTPDQEADALIHVYHDAMEKPYGTTVRAGAPKVSVCP